MPHWIRYTCCFLALTTALKIPMTWAQDLAPGSVVYQCPRTVDSYQSPYRIPEHFMVYIDPANDHPDQLPPLALVHEATPSDQGRVLTQSPVFRSTLERVGLLWGDPDGRGYLKPETTRQGARIMDEWWIVDSKANYHLTCNYHQSGLTYIQPITIPPSIQRCSIVPEPSGLTPNTMMCTP